MPEKRFINPDTGEIIEIQSIEKCEHQPMRGWYRVFEEDGSTIAYVPDIVTARVVSAAFAMLSHCQMACQSSKPPRSVIEHMRLIIDHAVHPMKENQKE